MSEQKINSLVEELSQLTVLDMSKLKEALEEKWGVKASAGAPMLMAAAPAAGGAGADRRCGPLRFAGCTVGARAPPNRAPEDHMNGRMRSFPRWQLARGACRLIHPTVPN